MIVYTIRVLNYYIIHCAVVIVRCRVQYGRYFRSFSYFETYLIAKSEKRGKYLPILHKAMCDNYFIVKCLSKSNVSRATLHTNCIEITKYNLMLTWYKKVEAKTAKAKIASTNFTLLYFVFPNSFVSPYFNSSILYYVHLFGVWRAFENIFEFFQCFF